AANLEQKLSQNDSRSKDVGETKQIDTFIPKEQSLANISADDLARIQVYDEICDCLSGVSCENFCKQIQKACKIYKLFNGLGKNKIKQVKSYSANRILKLSNSQIQYIIEHFTNESQNSKDTFTSNKVECVLCDLRSHPYMTKSSNSNDLAERKVSASSIFPSNPTRDHVYFHNKILKQYPNLCQEKGRYKIRSYNLKCEQRRIEIE
ncbi:19450_t:CDS:2, partial [Racocetra fulgida]